MRNPETIKIGKREMEALAELIRYVDSGRPYYWREASMAKLICADMVTWGTKKPGHSRSYVPTEIGRAAVKDQTCASK